jgi:DNA-directed RNA polymerase subunit RPC12/RpoP
MSKSYTYQCNLCGSLFSNQKDLIFSYRIDKLKIVSVLPSNADVHICIICGEIIKKELEAKQILNMITKESKSF